jgi:hypothetical protein
MVITPIETVPIEDGVEVEGGIAPLIWIVAVDGMFLFLSNLSSKQLLTTTFLSLVPASYLMLSLTSSPPRMTLPMTLPSLLSSHT